MNNDIKKLLQSLEMFTSESDSTFTAKEWRALDNWHFTKYVEENKNLELCDCNHIYLSFILGKDIVRIRIQTPINPEDRIEIISVCVNDCENFVPLYRYEEFLHQDDDFVD